MEEKRCYGCMRIKKEDGVCPVCGYDNKQANEPHQLPAGTVLKEQYLIGRVLGQGGFGITYMGWDLYLDIPVAIKEYFPNGYVMRNCNESFEVHSYGGKIGERFESNKKRFRREVKMLARFSEVQEIVQVKTFFMDNNTAYIVMEYIEGTTLKDYVKQKGGKISREETYKILRPVMRALGQVHRAGLVHRDISPDNIMLLPDGRVKLLDFGAVRDIGMDTTDATLTKSTEAILKQGFGPIEQYQHHGKLGPWTDVYALCATIYFCLTGEVPSDAPERALGGEMVWFTDRGVEIPKNEETVIQEGMALRVEERIPDVQTLYHRLFDEEPEPGPEPEPDPEPEPGPEPDPEPSPEPGPEPGPELVDSSKKKKRFLLIGILIAVIAVIAIAVGVSQSQKSSGDAGTTENTENEPENTDEEAEIQSGQCGDDITWELNMDTGELVLSGSGDIYDYDSPYEEVEEGETQNLSPWYDYCMEIKSIVIGDGIGSIGPHAFINCTNLTSVDFGSVTEITDEAFRNDTALKEITLPESCTKIGLGAFAYCTSLEEVTILGENVEISFCAFGHNEDALRKVTMPGNTNLIVNEDDGTTPFLDEEGSQPSHLVIYSESGSAVEEFANTYNIAFVSTGMAAGTVQSGQCGDDVYWELAMDTGVLTISGNGDMWDYDSVDGTWYEDDSDENDRPGEIVPWASYSYCVKKVVFEEGVTSVGNGFSAGDYSALTELDLGSVTSIGLCAFQSTKLTEIIVPESVTEVIDYAFSFNNDLKKIEFPESVSIMCSDIVAGCPSLESVIFYGDPVIQVHDGSILGSEEEDGDSYPANAVIYGLADGNVKAHCTRYGLPFVVLEE